MKPKIHQLLFAIAATSAAIIFLCAPAAANVSCPALFSDHMVLQRDQPVAIWGQAGPGEMITVAFAGQTKTVTADPPGQWKISLDPMAVSSQPRTLVVTGNNRLAFHDVLVGEVWFASGQSNMEKPFGQVRGQNPVDHSPEELAHAGHPQLRLFEVPYYSVPKAGDSTLAWYACSPETLRDTHFSAAAYIFGRDLQERLQVPVGIILSALGGTRIDAWMPRSAFTTSPGLRGHDNDRYFSWVPLAQPTELDQSMIAPYEGYTVKGFIWYQGESDCMDNDITLYAQKQNALIRSWRSAWNEPKAPFYFVLLAPFVYSRHPEFPKHVTPDALPLFWEEQLTSLAVPATAAVSTLDLVNDFSDIHPTNKQGVGSRLARLAAAESDHAPGDLVFSPKLAASRTEANGRIVLKFSDARGLHTTDAGLANGFTIAGGDRRFFSATAEVSGDEVRVWSPAVPDPVAVRYLWTETPRPNLANAGGLPVFPFRTDRWPVETLASP